VLGIVSVILSVHSEADDRKHNSIHKDITKKELRGSETISNIRPESISPLELSGVTADFPYGYGNSIIKFY
jgi:hypothetical protein